MPNTFSKDTEIMGEKITVTLLLGVFVAVFGGSFQYGYNIAVMNGPAKMMQVYYFNERRDDDDYYDYYYYYEESSNNTMNSTPATDYDNLTTLDPLLEQLSDSDLLKWSITVSIYTIGGMIGSLSVGALVGRLGRKNALLSTTILSFVAALLMGTSKPAHSLIMVIIARFIIGIHSGLSTGLVPMYIGEISPKDIRGAIGVANQLFMTIGILTAQILSLSEIFGTPYLWPVLLACTAVPSLVEVVILPFIPESPRCLLIDVGDEVAAKKALYKFRGTRNVHAEMEEMRLEAEAETSDGQMSLMEILKDKSVRWQLITVTILQVGQQLCGINAIFFYLNTIFANAGVEESMLNYAAVSVGAVNVLMTIVTTPLVEKLGRKILLVGGFCCMMLFCVIMTISLNLTDTVEWMPILSIVSVIGFVIGFAVGPGPVPWLLTTELFRQSARPAAFIVGCSSNWTANFILALLFPFMQKAMKGYIFLFFLCVILVVTIYTVIVLPETKNKTFQEINNLFAKRNGIKPVDMELLADEERRLTEK